MAWREIGVWMYQLLTYVAGNGLLFCQSTHNSIQVGLERERFKDTELKPNII